MPLFSNEVQYGANGGGALLGGSSNYADVERAANSMNRQDRGFFPTIAGDAALGVVDLADTVSSSIPYVSKALGFDRGDFNTYAIQKAGQALGMPGLLDFYNDNKQGIEVASGIYGVIAAEMTARRLTAPASALMTALKTVPFARRIATLDTQYASAMRAVRLADESLAARGALGAESFVGKVVAPAESLAGIALGGREATRAGFLSTAKNLAFAKGVRQAAATEAVMAVTLNQNGFLYTDDMSHNLMWMGLGLGIGGGVERFAAAYQARKFVNSDYIRRINAKALDPDMDEEARLLWKNIKVDPTGVKGIGDIPGGQGFLGGAFTDNVTNLLVNSKSLVGTETANTVQGIGLFANRSNLATQHLKQARDEIQKVVTKGVEGNGFTRMSMDSRGYGNHIDQVMKADPTSMYGLEEIGGIPDNLSAYQVHLGRESRVNEILEKSKARIDQIASGKEAGTKAGAEEMSRLQDMVKRYEWKRQFIPTVLIDGERATLSDARALDGWREPQIMSTKPDDESRLWETVTDHISGKVGLDSNGTVYLPKNIDINQADHFDILRLYRLGQQMIQHAKSAKDFEMAIPRGANWFQLDLAEEVLRANPAAKVYFPEGMTREAAQVESFAQKAEALKANQTKRGKDFDPAVEASKMRVRLNLPRLSAYERALLESGEHPIEQLLRGAAEYGPDEIRKMSVADLRIGAEKLKRIGDFAPSAKGEFDSLSGKSFGYMLDDFGQPTSPILGYSRPLNKMDWTPDVLAERMAAQRLHTVTQLMNGSDYTGNLAKVVFQHPDFDAASRTHELVETQIQGSVAGTNHLTAHGAAIKGLKARDWIGRDNKTLLGASRIQQAVQQQARAMFQEEAKGLQALAGQLDSPRNAASKLLLNQFIAARPGWELATKRGVVETADALLPGGGKVSNFRLAQTERNQKRWQQIYGEAMPADAVLQGRNGPVGLDEFGTQFMTEFGRMTDSIRANKNRLLSSQNLRNIESTPMYIPPKNLNGKFVGFTMDTEGNLVPGMTVIADTEADFARQRGAIEKLIEDDSLHGYRFRTRDDVKSFADIWDRAQMDMIDPGTTAIQGGKQNRGLLTSSDVDLKGVEGILNSLRDQYLNHSQDVLNLTMKDQLKSAEARARIATSETRNNAKAGSDQKYRNIHEMYIENLTGASPLNSKGSIYGWLYNGVEGKVDQFLSQVAPGVSRQFSRVWDTTNAYIDRAKFWSDTPAARKDFDSLSSHLGEYMPFRNVAEMMERQGATMPPTMKGIMAASSKFTAGMMLRVMEPVMALMNMGGMVNAMPSVIRHVQQQVGETVAEHAARVGHVANIFEGVGRSGESLGVLDMAKVMTKGFQRAWKKEAELDFNYMKRNGYLTQEVAEFQKQFGAIETKADWERFMFGSPGAKNFKRNQDGAVFGEKGLVGWLSILTDKSEDFSRSWGHMVGLEMAETIGIRGMEAKHAFAHDLANKMIANYNPANRPEVFQGALGAPLGLFQSFIMNYYQRMFRYIETKDMHSFATQYAMQAGLFGATTVPGYAEASKFFFSMSQGNDDLNGAIRERFGQSTADVLLSGTLGNIPKLFGAQGIALSSRGDTAVRIPGTQTVDVPIPFTGMSIPAPGLPAVSVAAKLMTGIGQGFKALMNENRSMAQLAEIASNTMPNRPIAGMIEQFWAGGNDIDNAGQIVSETQSMSESVYRMMGTRSIRQANELEAFYSNKNQQSLQNSALDGLRQSTRSAFRSKDYDKIPKILESYLEAGGDPRNARRWLKEQFEAATETRAERQLNSSLKSADKMGYAVRLLDAGVSIDDDEATETYADSLPAGDGSFEGANADMMDYGGSATTLESQQF